MTLQVQSAPESQTASVDATKDGSRRAPDWTAVVLWVAAGVTAVWIGILSWATLYAVSRLFA